MTGDSDQMGQDNGGRLMPRVAPRVALCGLNLAPGMAPMGRSRCSNYFFELEPRYGIEP